MERESTNGKSLEVRVRSSTENLRETIDYSSRRINYHRERRSAASASEGDCKATQYQHEGHVLKGCSEW